MKFTAIRENHLYAKVYAKGKKYVGKYLVVYVLRDLHAKRYQKARPDKTKVNRIGLTVTKKIGNAVTRNRCKRLLREAYRTCRSYYGERGGSLVVLVARDALQNAKLHDVLPEMQKAYRLLELQNDHS